MKVIIAEKPSLARNIVAGIGKMNTKKGYYENDEYIVTYAFGHLFTLCDIEDYKPKKDGKWTMDNLPCFPEKFKFRLKKDKNNEVDKGVKEQFEIIKQLVNRNDVDTIINAGDSDREGEIIVRLCIINSLKTKKRVLRLWLPDQTPKTIKQGLIEMKDDKEYNNLANEGFARTYIDWLYGVNLTRYATLKTGVLLRVGRVIIPIVKAIYDRDMKIKNFVPELYYGITSKEETNGEIVELNSKKKFKKEEEKEAKELCEKYNNLKAIVKDKEVKKDSLKPGKLYSLSKLQNFLGKKYKMPMTESLSIVQKLYEEGYLTYPRTNSEYLATNEKDKIKNIIDIVKKMGYPVIFKDKKTIFDDSKIESHSALTPTYKVPNKDKLSKKELLVYKTVLNRFIAVFCEEDCKIEKSKLLISLGNEEEFELKGTIIIEKGWTKYDDYNKNDKMLPNLNKGDVININFNPVSKKTSALKHYTIETLNNYLKNPFKEDKKKNDEDDEEDYKAMFEGIELGTEATRTSIIKNAINSKYIELKKDTYYILNQGIYLIESLNYMNINMDKYKTINLSKALKKVFHGKIKVLDAVNIATDEIKNVFNSNTDDIGLYGDYIGKCPKCKKDVIRNRYGYGCSGYKDGCNFSIPRVICKKVIPKNEAKLLLNEGRTNKLNNFISKNNKEFSACLKLENDKIVFDFK